MTQDRRSGSWGQDSAVRRDILDREERWLERRWRELEQRRRSKTAPVRRFRNCTTVYSQQRCDQIWFRHCLFLLPIFKRQDINCALTRRVRRMWDFQEGKEEWRVNWKTDEWRSRGKVRRSIRQAVVLMRSLPPSAQFSVSSDFYVIEMQHYWSDWGYIAQHWIRIWDHM